jgi:ATP-dependent Lhr-like helicase
MAGDAAHASGRDPLAAFHPAVGRWFRQAFPGGPTPAQAAAWPAIAGGRHTLVSAPTGSGKTLTAFLAAIDALVRRGLSAQGLPDETVVVYVSPLKALSNDIQLNLEKPLAGIRRELARLGLADVEIRTAVRTGDTPAAERTRTLKRPPHLLVTTPESLYVLLGSAAGRLLLRTVRSVIVDEIHAVAASKRGSHLALSLERLAALTGAHHGAEVTRIGVSATQKPIAAIARFLVGDRLDCAIVDIGYAKARDLALVVPPTPLGAVMSHDQWEQVYQQLTERILAHRTTLVFVNTRRMAERAARHLAELLGREAVAAHHGSLAKEARLAAEQRLKRGELRVLVATASLELGLDIGDVDLVCQIGSPRSIATFLQRAGRSGHAVGGIPKARLFPQTRDELVECTALLDCVRRGELDALRIPQAPLDVLAQQLIAEIAGRAAGAADDDGIAEDDLFALVRRAMPYATLARNEFDAVVRMLADGFSTHRGTRGALLHRDAVHRRLRARRAARLTALTSGGTIPETGDYSVVLEPDAQTIGTINEDFAIESLAGDVFQLGNASYRILRIESGRVRVVDAVGAAPNIPFWLGEAPGRSDELSIGVSRLRDEIAARLAAAGRSDADSPSSTIGALRWLSDTLGLDEAAASQVVDYLRRGQAALGTMPSRERIVIERFFDESGGMQLVIHAPFGSRINRAWGLALRKRFCRRFNFELQAAATEDAIILSLSTSHSFALDEVGRYLHSSSALDVLVQALLDAPMFGARWRWNATNALALPRFAGGRKVAPQLQRMRSEDLLAGVFPDQVACAENLAGERELPDHPLVTQTLRDCLTDAMDADGWLALLRRIECGEVAVMAQDLTGPSPLAAEAINARPYAFLDDAPLEERRSRAVQSRRYAEPTAFDDLGRLDPEAIAAVRAEAWPQARDVDEMHEALTDIAVLTDDEIAHDGKTPMAGDASLSIAARQWPTWLGALAADGRATRLERPRLPGLWVATERLPMVRAVIGDVVGRPEPVVPPEFAAATWDRETALRELLRARLSALGPTTVEDLAKPLGLARGDVLVALHRLQAEGTVMAGRFGAAPAARGPEDEWCERHLLARIHRYTLGRLRREIEPVEPRDYLRFLFDWQHLAEDARVAGPEALAAVLAQLEGFEAPAVAWESELLAARVSDYSSSWLDDLCTSGRIVWTRLRAASNDSGGGGSPRQTPLLLLPRRHAALWTRLAPPPDEAALPGRTRRVIDHLAAHGASYFDEIADGGRLLRSELESALADAVMRGRVHCDSFFGLRSLLVPPSRRVVSASRRRRGASWSGIQDAGRWALVRRPALPGGSDREAEEAAIEHVARTLLRRYGVVCWRLLEREPPWLPPWRRLVRVYQRLEARGEIRGGRFIAGLSGEQFALPEAVTALRQARRAQRSPQWVAVAATDPANVSGTVVAGTRVPRLPGTRVVYRDGIAVAAQTSDRLEWWIDAAPEDAAAAAALLHGVGRRVADTTS